MEQHNLPMARTEVTPAKDNSARNLSPVRQRRQEFETIISPRAFSLLARLNPIAQTLLDPEIPKTKIEQQQLLQQFQTISHIVLLDRSVDTLLADERASI